MRATILLAIEDQNGFAALRNCLEDLGLTVLTATTGDEALEVHAEASPDLVVAGLALPDLHGLDLCRLIRRESDVPLIVMGQATSGLDGVLALELGADDFIGSGCGPEEFQERVKAALRRGAGVEPEGNDDEVLDFGEIVIDRRQHRLTVGDMHRELTGMETELLWALARRAGAVVPSKLLLKEVWGYPEGVRTRTLDVHIGRLRKKLGEDGRNPRHIVTVRCVGYRFEPDADGHGRARRG